MAINADNLIKEWWQHYQPDPRSDYDKIVSGVRQQLSTSGEIKYLGGVTQSISNSQLQTGACQYWVKGLYQVCSNWNYNTSKCGFEFETEEDKPSGYGVGACDMLGRRGWCSKYNPIAEQDIEEFVCIAPCIEKSGIGKQVTNEFGFLSYRPFLPSEIKGYNADSRGVGLCDGWGMGRSNQRTYEYVEQVYVDLPVCRHYRPQQMGFGVVQPRPYHGSDTPGLPFDSNRNWLPSSLKELHDGSLADPLVAMSIRLPFAFQVYNSRSMYQKCSHWKSETPSFFVVNNYGTDPSHYFIDMDGESYCECTDSICNPYREIASSETYPADVPWLIADVWASYGGIVCNGAKPECPCYTGKWVYCIDNNMRDGMRITADQIFELRFWASSWSSQDEYDDYYRLKPGPTQNGYADESTADIYTFTHWNKFNSTDPNESIMVGKKHHMCMPAPLHMREFDSNVYITKTLVEYPRLHENKGTNLIGAEVSYPTLVRELDDPTTYIPDIFIVYPYYTIDPWEIVECDVNDQPDFCFHDSNLMEDPTISIIGYTVLNKDVYVINADINESLKSSKAFDYIKSYSRAMLVPFSNWDDFNESMDSLIEDCQQENQGFYSTVTDDVGFFKLSNVKLNLNKLNTLYIICKYSAGNVSEYIFRKVKVKSRYWGAIIEQGNTVHEYTGNIYTNSFPAHFTPSYSSVGFVNNIIGKVQTVFSVYSFYKFGLAFDSKYFSYCINEYEEIEEDAAFWTQIGPTGYIWVEIDNNLISYLWDFDLVEAYFTVRDQVNHSVNLCGKTIEDKIVLEKVDVSRLSIPPNCLLLKTELPMSLFNGDWKLTVSYKYKILEPFKINPVWPEDLDEELSGNYFVSSPYNILHEEGSPSFTVSNIGSLANRATIKIMAFIVDDNDRVQTAAATKFVLQGCVLGCRSVDIIYRYEADAKAFDLQPSSGFLTWRGKPSVSSISADGIVHRRNAKCGDHECNSSNCIGAVWFPFNNCTSDDFYNILNGAAQCTMPITEGKDQIALMGEAAWRYCLVDEYEAWVTPGGSWASACGSSFYYHYSRAQITNMRFSGRGRLRSSVNTTLYLYYDWQLPPFGNYGRGYVERYLTRDYISFISMQGPSPSIGTEYVPMVFDKEDLVTDINCFASQNSDYYFNEPFTCFSSLSNFKANFISEELSDERYRFEDIINIVSHGNCMYPLPLIENGNSYSVVRYSFKNENHVWAWPEYWRGIERNIESTNGYFRFLDIETKNYFFDVNKYEHRFIPDEGIHTITFIPPTINDEDNEEIEDKENNKYPSVSIDGAFPRFFKIIYDEYNGEQIEWMDESTTGEENSSGGSSEGTIYEIANNSENSDIEWYHDFNTVFDIAAELEPNVDRKIYLGKDSLTQEDIYKYYNRGLIFNITKDRLKFLPYKVYSDTLPDINFLSSDSEQYLGFWSINSIGVVPITIKIDGFWGSFQNSEEDAAVVYCKPAVELIESEEDPATGYDQMPDWPEELPLIVSTNYKTGIRILGLQNYNITINVDRTPNRMTQALKYFMVRLSSIPGELLNINSITVETGQYTTATETIFVWERKYFPGTAVLGYKNADGPGSNIYRTYSDSNKNAGQYFPFNKDFSTTTTPDFDRGGKVISKLNMVSFSEIHREDEDLDITFSSLKDIELQAQKVEYDAAYNLDNYDELSFNGVRHPAVEEWLSNIDIDISIPRNMYIKYDKVSWEKNNIANQLDQSGDFFQPGGHYFAWSDKAFKTRCYLLGGVQDVYMVDWVHHKHGPTMSTADAGTSYAGWPRVQYYEGRLWNMDLLGQQDGQNIDKLSGAKNFGES